MATTRIALLALSTWLVLGCGNDPGGGNCPVNDAGAAPDATLPEGIRIDQQVTRPGAPGCFQVDLSWSLLPEENERTLTVRYAFRADRYLVEGLAERQIEISDASAFQVTEAFEVCPVDPSQDTQFFDFEITASGETSRYLANPSVAHLVDAHTWATDLAPQLAMLRAQVDGGDRSPAVIKELHRTEAAFFHGGFNQFDSRVDAEVDATLASFVVRPPSGVTAAWRQLLKDHGKVADVSFDLDYGLVTSLTLNETFRLPSRREVDVVNLILSSPIRDFLPLGTGDTLRTAVAEEHPGGLLVHLYRYRNGVAVVPDQVIAVVKRVGIEEHLAALEVELGDLAGASCDGIQPGMELEYDISQGWGMSDVTLLKALNRYDGVHYRCELRWLGLYTDESGMSWPWIRVVDGITSEMVQDGTVMTGEDSDTTPHRVMVDQTVPYKTHPRIIGEGNVFNVPTSMAGGEILMMLRGPTDASGIEHVAPCENLDIAGKVCRLTLPDPPAAPTFRPDDFLGLIPAIWAHDHPDIGYLPWFGGQGERYGFDVSYFDAPGAPNAFLHDAFTFAELARDASDLPDYVDPADEVIRFSPRWKHDTHCDDDAPDCGNFVHRAQGMAAGLHFYAQYARYIVGVPYTLNLNPGVIPNPPRPHWQFLDAGADPARQLVCGR